MPLSEALDQTLAALADRRDHDPAWRSTLRTALSRVRDDVRAMVGSGPTVEFGMGYGAVAQVPWVVVLRPGQSPREGHYPVFLFARDGSAVFLSLNQGTELRTLHDVRVSTDALRRAMNELPPGLQSEIDLRATTAGPRKYEAGNVAAFQYPRGAVPNDEQLGADLARLQALSDALNPADESEDLTNGSAWIFQSSPEQYELSDALDNLSELTWLVNQYTQQIHAGDRVYLWETGRDAGVVAVGEILTDPAMLTERTEEQSFWRNRAGFVGPKLRVRLGISDVLEPRLLRRDLVTDPILRDLRNLRFANATNFPITPDQEAELRRLIVATRGPRAHRMVLKIAPGENASLWPDCLANGYVRVGWDKLGDLREYKSERS